MRLKVGIERYKRRKENRTRNGNFRTDFGNFLTKRGKNRTENGNFGTERFMGKDGKLEGNFPCGRKEPPF